LARYTAVLDTCVLVPIALADTLLRIAERELYRPLWSDRILREAIDVVTRIHPEIPSGKIAKRFAVINENFEDARIEGWEDLEAAITLPDPDDRHVVAAAVRGRADAIVTANTRDFPPQALDQLNIEVIHPDDFLLSQLDLAPRVILDILREQASQTKRPPLTPVDLIARLARAGAPGFADEAGRLV
jgi:predicted nucleic acid-binding protein